MTEKKVRIGTGAMGIPIRISEELFNNVADLKSEGLSPEEVAGELDKQLGIVRRIYETLERRKDVPDDQRKGQG